MARVRKPLFFMHDNRVTYLHRPLPKELLEDVEKALDAHKVRERSERWCYESLLFSIASQGTAFEKATKFLVSTHPATLEELTDEDLMRYQGKKKRLMYWNRFGPALDYMKKHGVQNVAEALVNKPFETRDALRDVKYLKSKTISFWHLCLGGDKLVTLDRHNNGQISGLGVQMSKRLYDPPPRPCDGRRIPSQPSRNEYLRIEEETLRKFEREPFFKPNGHIDAARVTTLFWVVGTLMARGDKLWESMMFYCGKRPKFKSPYSSDNI